MKVFRKKFGLNIREVVTCSGTSIYKIVTKNPVFIHNGHNVPNLEAGINTCESMQTNVRHNRLKERSPTVDGLTPWITDDNPTTAWKPKIPPK